MSASPFVSTSPRRTRSISIHSHDNIDRPPDYDPRAIIPDVDFINNPEDIIRQPRHQDRRPTTIAHIHARNTEYNFEELPEDTSPDPHNRPIDLSFLLEGTIEICVRITLNPVVSHETPTPCHSPPAMTYMPEDTLDRQTRRHFADEQVLSPSMIMLRNLLAAEEEKISQQQTASSISSPAIASSGSSRSTIPDPVSSEMGVSEPSTPTPRSRNTKIPISDSIDDSDTDTDDMDGETTKPDSFGEEIVANIKVRTPKSTELFSTVYVQSIRDVLVEYLSSFQVPYFMGLMILTTGIPTDSEIPVVVIVYEKDSIPDSRLPSVDDLPPDIHTSDYSIVFCEGTFNGLASSMSNSYRHLHESLVSGISIEGAEEGTVGLFIETEDNKFYGFSCGHILGKVGNHVRQPSLHDFRKHLETLERTIRNLEKEIKETKNQITKFVRQNTLNEVRQQLDTYKKYQGDHDRTTKKLLRIGKTVESEKAIIEYQGRTCYADWAVFVCDEKRLPGGEAPLDLNTPDHGVLSTVDWQRMNGFAEINWDMYVRKAGRTTGMTFGFVAGVHGDWVPPTFPEKTCREFYALEEKIGVDNQFASPGDSGAAVINDDGKIVSFVFAGINIDTIKVVFAKSSRIPDILKIKERRETDGSVRLEDVYTKYIRGQKFILIESANMMRERSTVREEIVRDC